MPTKHGYPATGTFPKGNMHLLK